MSLKTSTSTSISASTTQMTTATLDTLPDNAKAAAEAEKKAVDHELEDLAGRLYLDMQTKAKEELALQKVCLSEDMRKVVEHLEPEWEDTRKETTDEGYLDELQATLMTEAALELIRYQEETMIREAQEKGLEEFDVSLDDDDFFGKTARSLSKIEAQRRLHGAGYIFYVSRLSEEQATAENLHSPKEYEFLAQYLMEAGLEVVSSTYRSSVALETNYLRRK
jgi:hypothetical protein